MKPPLLQITFARCHVPTRQRGASLIEMLVSVLILTVGVLSLAALHAASLRYSKLAEFKTTATQLGEDLGDRMRANPTAVRNGDYVFDEAYSDTATERDVPDIPDCTDADTACHSQAAAAIAQRDLAEWMNQASTMLPGLGLYTQAPAAGSSVMDVWVAWKEPVARGGKDEAAEKLINDAYACPVAMKAGADIRCMSFRFTI